MPTEKDNSLGGGRRRRRTPHARRGRRRSPARLATHRAPGPPSAAAAASDRRRQTDLHEGCAGSRLQDETNHSDEHTCPQGLRTTSALVHVAQRQNPDDMAVRIIPPPYLCGCTSTAHSQMRECNGSLTGTWHQCEGSYWQCATFFTQGAAALTASEAQKGPGHRADSSGAETAGTALDPRRLI